MDKSEFVTRVNQYATDGTPFIFIIDFELQLPTVFKLEGINSDYLKYEVNGKTNVEYAAASPPNFKFQSFPMPIEKYETAFDIVKQGLEYGNTYLLNLTFPTPINLNLDLDEIFRFSQAKYKLRYDNFVIFSPECFVKIIDGYIYSYPMKGTIDASIPNARETILNDEKETWEHNTIVDLIRNDLSIVSTEVEVTKFRFIDELKTNKNHLLQVSSEIRGKLPENWKTNLGEILLKLLPAGSISGAPKEKTIEIIQNSEGGKRGFFTGIFGIFDGRNLDSGVNIRFIEKTPNGMQFRSGGGVTAMSKMENEYKEMIEKVYVPII